MQPKVIVDVGAAKGEFSRSVLMGTNDTKVFALEPNTDYFISSINDLKDRYKTRFSIFPYALGENSGVQSMFGSTQLNGQIGSLKKFNSSKIWDDYIAKKLNKVELEKEITVKVKTVKEFLQDSGVQEIDFLKIDTQGYDVFLLQNFLALTKVNCMVVEVNTTSNSTENIYEGDNNLSSLAKVISEFNLNILKIVPNWDLTELNVFLATNQADGYEILDHLKISRNPVFSRGWNISVIQKDVKINLKNLRKFLPYLIKCLIHPIHYSKKLFSLILKSL